MSHLNHNIVDRQLLTHDVTGQLLYWFCPEGRPSSIVSATIFPSGTGDDGTAESTAIDSTAIDPAVTTLDAASGDGQADARIINLTATTGGLIGWRYILENAQGQREHIEAIAIDDGVSITARHPLRNAYAAADAFGSVVIEATINDAWIQDTENITDDLNPNQGYRIRWEYVVDDITYVWDDYFDVVRYTGRHNVVPHDVDSRMPGWIDNLPVGYREDRGHELLDHAWEEVQIDLHGANIPGHMIRNRTVIRRLVVSKTLLLTEELKVTRTNEETAGYAIALTRYEGHIDKLIRRVGNTAMATDTSGAGTKVEPVSAWNK